jgi:peptide/nickel transport system substrate-binding protein
MNILKVLLVLFSPALLSNSVVIALSSNPNNLDPFFSTDGNSQNINRILHTSLVDFNKEMKFQCDLCQTFSEKVENGRHEITFILKENIRFWNGDELTAYDVENSVKYFQDEKINSVFRNAFLEIERVEVLGKYKVKLVFKKFKLENLSNLCLLKIIKYKKNNEHSNENIIGAGPYKLKGQNPIELVPAFDKTRPDFIFKVVKDETTLALKLLNKEIDLSVASISPRKEIWLKKNNPSISYWSIPSSNYHYLGLNLEREHLKPKEIRKALSLLVPRKKLMDYKIKDSGVLAHGMFSQAFFDNYYDFPIDEYNEKAATEIFLKQGYKKNKEGYFSKNGKPFTLDWKVNNNRASYEVVEVIKRSFEEFGIKVLLTTQEWGTFNRNFKTGAYDIVMANWQGFTGPDMLNFVFHSKNVPPNGGNRGRYINPEVDKLLDIAEVETNPNRRNQTYLQVQKVINEDYPYINLWHPKVSWIGNNCISGIDLLPNGSFSPLLSVKNNCSQEN